MSKFLLNIWCSFLDYSIFFWTNNYLCHGFIFVPREPLHFRNEYCTIFCGISGVLYRLYLVEGKYCPMKLDAPIYNEILGKTVGLLLKLSKIFWVSGKTLVLYSDLCLLKYSIEWINVWYFSMKLINMRWYFPEYFFEMLSNITSIT